MSAKNESAEDIVPETEISDMKESIVKKKSSKQISPQVKVLRKNQSKAILGDGL